jgi:mono/diheme cytochrome c family protein
MKSRALLLGALALVIVPGLREASRGSGAPPESAAAAKGTAAVSFTKDVVPFLTKHCYACHGNGKKRAGLELDKYANEEAVQKDRNVWENVLHMLRSGEMPPKERPRPAPAEVESAVQAIDALLTFDCTGPTNAGRVTLHRLNKVEYNNTIRDLIGIDFKPAADFPNDDVGYGFDNIGDVLSLSPLLLEKYLAAAEGILDQAIVIADPPKPTRNRLSGLRVSFGAGEILPRGGPAILRAKGEVSNESYCDEGDYIIRAEVYGQQLGEESVRAALRLNRADLQEFEIKAEQSAPATIEAKVRLKAGSARIGVAFLNPFSDPKIEDEKKRQRQLFVRNITVDGPYNPPPPTVPESHRRIMAWTPQLAIPHAASLVSSGLTPFGFGTAIELGNPSFQRETARAIISRFATRAFRRPVKPDEVTRFLKLYDEAEKEGERFEQRIRLALAGVLVSPHFLFRVELDPAGAQAGTAYPIGEYELASRLSYFLWSTMPDDELFALAAKGELRKNLEVQVRRMLDDPKSAAFIQNFAGQWLTLRKLAGANPDTKTFPNFDEELRAAMVRETELFFETIVREDRSIFDLIDADFTFVNERLAKHYGIEGVQGKEFRRVPAPAHRGGILTQASILTLTSNPTRTAPVKRGKWVLDQLLNTPPPPPPPDVPQLPEDKELKGSLRQVMEQHRASPVCASCHQRMDPIGFAFENFDAVGAWRDKDGDSAIDPSGVLPDGKTFKGPAELKAILKGKKELFSRCLTEKMLTYALGRGLESYDRCAVDKILAALEKNDYRAFTLLVEVVKSEPFQMRTATGGKQ